MQVVEGVLFFLGAARYDMRPLGGEDLALCLDHFRKFRSESVAHGPCRSRGGWGERGCASPTLRDKHESVVCPVMLSFILMTEARRRQVEHRVKDRAAPAGGGKRRDRFLVRPVRAGAENRRGRGVLEAMGAASRLGRQRDRDPHPRQGMRPHPAFSRRVREGRLC